MFLTLFSPTENNMEEYKYNILAKNISKSFQRNFIEISLVVLNNHILIICAKTSHKNIIHPFPMF